MTAFTVPPSRADSVPLADRQRVTQYLRVTAIVLVLLCAAFAPSTMAPGHAEAVQVTLVYAVGVAALEAVHRLRAARPYAVILFSTLLMLDGLWLAWATYLSGGMASPVRYAVLLHVAAVALVASYRTALKLAMWHSLLLSSIHNAVVLDVLLPTAPELQFGGTPTQQLLVFVVVLWLVAISTSTLSAVNERELRRRRHDLEALTALADAVEGARNSSEIAATLLRSAVDAFGFRRGVVLAGPDGQLPLLAGHGIDRSTAGRPGPSGIVERAHEQHETQLVRGFDRDSDAWLSSLLPGAEDVVVVPLMAEQRPLGALVLEQPRRAGGRIQRRVVVGLERSASYAALALRNTWLLEQVQRLAATDGLTKIANRRTFETTLEREVARAVRNREPVSLVLLDLDHFKRLNDTHGHQAGDEVLRNVALALSCECREFDTAARYGGEEFAVVLPGCSEGEAAEIAERLRRAVAAAPAAVPMTASAGVATFPTHAIDADSLVRAADDALYRSKHAGRDRTTTSSATPHTARTDDVLRRAVLHRLGRQPGPPLDG